jgi:hypothetical protein
MTELKCLSHHMASMMISGESNSQILQPTTGHPKTDIAAIDV